MAKLLQRTVFVFGVITVASVAALRWFPPFTSAFMIESLVAARLHGEDSYRLNQKWIDWFSISPHASAAVIAAEDQQFKRHYGFDLRAIWQAFRRNQTSHRIRGASTLSQQTAKNLYLYAGKSFFRKGLEAYFTALLELLLSKQRILEIYLNIAQFGRGIFGVEAASQHFFHKSARWLTASEAALLAASLPNPVILRVDKPSSYMLKRRSWILQQMGQLGHLADVYDETKK